MPAPVPKQNQLLEQVAVLAASPILNEIALRRLEDEARTLVRTDASGAHAVLGAVAAIRGDVGEVVRHHELSIKLDNDVPNWLYYCTSLGVVDDPAELLNVAKRASSTYPDVPEFLDLRIVSSLETAAFHEARALCSEWTDRYGRFHDLASMAGTLADATDANCFSAKGAREVLELGREVLHNKGVRVTEHGTVLQPDDDAFLWSRQVLASPESAAELNEEFADRVAARDDLLEDPGFRFVVMFDGAA